jgi:ribosomal protein S18 acetylase RimI-like enzyme
MAHIEIRPARAEDREAVLAFCTQTWSWGDYIGYVWDEWLHNPNGQLLIATADSKPVGVVNMQMLDKTNAWLEGLRVDPNYRRQGIARALTENALLEAMRREATYARLMIETTSEASVQLFESMHMRRVGSFAIYEAPSLATSPERAAKEQTQLATQGDLDDIIDYLNVSNIFPLVGGLYYVWFAAYPITAELLEAKIAARQLYLLRRWDRLDGLAIVDTSGEGIFRKSRLSLGYIDGTTIESISLIAYDLRHHLVGIGLESIRAYAPDLMLVHDALGGIGYEPEGTVYCTFERGLV